jgi:acyl carrier protein
MSPDEMRRVLFEAITSVAPESDPASVGEDDDLRDALDLDSMDFLNVVIALHERLGIDIPEGDYGKMRTVRGAVEYLTAKVAA